MNLSKFAFFADKKRNFRTVPWFWGKKLEFPWLLQTSGNPDQQHITVPSCQTEYQSHGQSSTDCLCTGPVCAQPPPELVEALAGPRAHCPRLDPGSSPTAMFPQCCGVCKWGAGQFQDRCWDAMHMDLWTVWLQCCVHLVWNGYMFLDQRPACTGCCLLW